jgi:hypothetical protein
MNDRAAIISAKVSKLADVIADGNKCKDSPPGNASTADVRKAETEAAREVVESGGSVAAVENVALPSERI